MAFERNRVRRNDHAQPSLELAADGVGGNGKNWEPKNDEPERGLVVFEESARVAATVRFPEELLAQTHRGKQLRCRASQFVCFVRLCVLQFVGVDIGRRKSSSANFRIQ